MNAKSQNCQNCQNPEGWDKPWPFADEIELFRIPEEEQETALNIEIRRETWGTFRSSLLIEEGQMIDPPWLSLSKQEKQALIRNYSSISIASHSDLLSLNEPKKIDEDCPLHEDSYDWRPAGSLAIYDHFARNRPRPGQESVGAKDLKICLSINKHNQVGIEKLAADFKEIIGLLMKEGALDGTGAHGTGKDSDRVSRLQNLAILRARHWLDGESFHLPFKGTSYSFYGSTDKPEEIRAKADKRRERIKKFIREHHSRAPLLSDQTHINRQGKQL